MGIDCFVANIAAPAKNALVGGPFGSDLVSKDYVEKGVPVIRGTNMGHGRWIGGDFAYVTEAKADSLAANCAKPGDIIFTQRGTLGQVALVPANGADRYLISQSQMKLTVDETKADPLFLYYVFTSPEQQEYIRQNAIQTGVPHTNLGILRKTPLRLPPLPEQKAIARILGTLDDKIELNRRMNATLEAMARALFQSWFVDFDPVRRKSENRKVRSEKIESHDLSNFSLSTSHFDHLFPDSFQPSELGEIPKGWSVEPLSRHLNVIKGRSYKSSELAESKTALVTLKSFQRGGGYRPDGLKAYTGDYKPDQRISPGDLVVAYTDVTQAAEIIGKPAIVRSDATYETLVASLDVGIVRPISERASIPFLYCLFLTDRFQAHAYAHATGTTVLHLSSKAVPSYEFCVPSQPISEAFAKLATPLFQLVDQNDQQSRTLVTLRDTLLPKLLSGALNPRKE